MRALATPAAGGSCPPLSPRRGFGTRGAPARAASASLRAASRLYAVLALLVVTAARLDGVAGTALAQDDGSVDAKATDRLSLVVHGRATLPADQVDVELVVQGHAEDGREAEKRHREKLKKVVRALEELKSSFEKKPVPGAPEAPPKKKTPKRVLEEEDDEEDGPRRPRKEKDAEAAVEEGPDPPGFTVELREGRSMVGVARNPGDGMARDGSVSFATAVIVRMKGIAAVARPKLRRRLAEILDTATEAGADMGADGISTRPAFRFRVRDNEELRELAHKDALTVGRERAARLARLAGRDLGPLLSINEQAWTLRAGSADAVGFDAAVGRLGNNRINNHEMTISSSEIELEVQLALDFELAKTANAPPPPAPAPAPPPAKK